MFSVVFFQSCKKSISVVSSPKYYLTATINGNLFTTTRVAVASQNGVAILAGLTVIGADSSLLALGFPLSIKSGISIPYNIPDSTVLAFKKTKPTLVEYTSDSIVLKGQGAFMITSLVKDSVITGNFSGKVIDNAGMILSITNGSFKSLFSHTGSPVVFLYNSSQ